MLGMALAEAAARAGHPVTLLLGPVDRPIPESVEGLRIHRFETTGELAGLLGEHFPGCRTLIMAAAVSDYKAVRLAEEPSGVASKLERSADGLTLQLEPTDDLVARVAAGKRADQMIIAFALEEADQLEGRAAEKLKRKRVDAIVANPLETMGAPTIDPVLFTGDGRRHATGRLSKRAFADRLIGWVTDRSKL